MELKTIMTVAVSFFALLALLGAGRASAKSLPGTNPSGLCLTSRNPDSLYPNTNTLALHPMDDTPFQQHPTPAPAACPSASSVTADDSLSQRSTCPYDYTTNYNQNRIPAVIQEARCLCSGCLDPTTGQQSPFYQCEEIRYPVKVLHRNSNSPTNNFEEYTLATETIAVGCACSRFL